MPSFAVSSRVTSPINQELVDAPSREKAIEQTVSAGMTAPGTEVEVMNVEEVPPGYVLPTEAEGAKTEQTDTGKALPPPT